MTTQTTPEAEALVRDILYASGSSLDFFSMERTRSKMFSAAQKHIDLAKAKNFPPYPGLWYYEKDGTIRQPTTSDI